MKGDLARAFGRAADDYELGRPDWPSEAIDRLMLELELGPQATVVDLAAGTGKLTRLLLPRFAQVVAVEPDGKMRAKLEELSPELESLSGRAEELPLADDSAEAVFVGEAFHWFDGESALSEIARVLRRRGGGLALLWNVPTPPLEPSLPKEVEEAFDALVESAFRRGGQPGGVRYASGAWREPFADSAFDELACAELHSRVEVGRDELAAYYLSISSIASLPDEDRRELGEALRNLLPDVRYSRSLRTDLCWTRLAH